MECSNATSDERFFTGRESNSERLWSSVGQSDLEGVENGDCCIDTFFSPLPSVYEGNYEARKPGCHVVGWEQSHNDLLIETWDNEDSEQSIVTS